MKMLPVTVSRWLLSSSRCPKLLIKVLNPVCMRQKFGNSRYFTVMYPNTFGTVALLLGTSKLCPHVSLYRQTMIYQGGTAQFSSDAFSDPIEENQEPVKQQRKFSANYIRREWLDSQNLFREHVSNKNVSSFTDDDWLQIKEMLSDVSGRWQVLCIQTLYQDKNVSLGRSLMEFLQRQQCQEHNLIIQTYFIGLLGETSEGSTDQEDETKACFDKLLTQTDILDAASIEVLNSGLASTRHYHECLKLLSICKETSIPGPSFLVKILRAGLRHHDSEMCRLIESELGLMNEPTSFIAFASQVINECLAAENEAGLNMVMNFIQKHNLLLPRKALDEILDSFNRYQPNRWLGRHGYIHHRGGNCVVCGHQMNRLKVGDAEFRSLQKAFMDQVIIGSNIFYKSTPGEVNNFVEFIKRTGPFDVVLDGLNIVHKNQRLPQEERLDLAVDYFNSQGKKVLILGSKTLTRFITKVKKMDPRPEVYLTSTTKADDVFFLYAALCSGKDTLIVSHDKLRDHKFCLDPSIRHTFHKWLLSVQVYDWFISRNYEFTIGRRHLFDLGPAKDAGGWHIPEHDIDKNNHFGSFSVLCLRDIANQTDSTKPVRKHNKIYDKVSSNSPKNSLKEKRKDKHLNLKKFKSAKNDIDNEY